MSDERTRRSVAIVIVNPGELVIKGSGISLAVPYTECDFEIELSGISGNHAIRLNLAEPGTVPECGMFNRVAGSTLCDGCNRKP